MATFNKIDSFVEALAEKSHDLGTDSLRLLLTNNAPVATNSVLADLVDITAGNGYVAGGPTLTVTGSSQTGGTYSLVMTDEVITAAGGSIGPFRYLAIYNDTALNDELIGWYDYGSSITLADTETLTVDFAATTLTLV